MTNKKWMGVVFAAVMAVATAGCDSDLTQSSSPVELLVTNTQQLQRIDILGGTNCDRTVGTVIMRSIIKRAEVAGQLNDIRVRQYRVSYVRTDGGRQVPAPFVRSIDTLVGAGTTGSLTNFLIFETGAFNQSPFVALRTANGGRDPETGRPVVKMEVILEVFGQTLGGDNVAGSTRFPLDFCYDCNGCL